MLKHLVALGFMWMLIGMSVQADPFELLQQGAWVLDPSNVEDCEDPFVFLPSADRKSIEVVLTKPAMSRGKMISEAHYRVLASTASTITMFLEHETFRDDSGQLVHWRLEFRDESSFVWVRSDWQQGLATGQSYRCRISS